jgi:hypothetical protein
MAVALKGVPVPTRIECIAERPDGTRFWFTPCPAVVRDGGGRIIGGINLLTAYSELDRLVRPRSTQLLDSDYPPGTRTSVIQAWPGFLGAWRGPKFR